MAITVRLPDEIERQLRADFPDVERRVTEGYALDAYRRGELSSHQVSLILGLDSRWQTIQFLSAHGSYPNYDVDDFAQDVKTLEGLKSGGRQEASQ